MIAVGYCRFSSDMQRDGYSIEAQKDAIKKYCHDNGIELLTFYVDEAISGTTDERPSFQKMIRDSHSKQFDTVIVHKLDRFSRNKYDSAIYKKKLKDNKVKLISVLERLDDSPESVILESLLEGMSEYYSKNLSREVRKGQRVAATKGLAHGPAVPLGYKKEANTRKIIVDEETKDIAIKVFEMKANGEQTLKVFEFLKQKGINLGYPSRVLDIIRNPLYKGIYSYAKKTDHREDFAGLVEPIVSEELWNKANDTVKAQYSRKRTKPNLLAGLLYCEKCGAHMNSTSNRKNRYYVCSNRAGTKFDSLGKRIVSCDCPYTHAPELEYFVMQNLKELFNDKKTLNEIKDKINLSRKKEYSNNEVELLEKKLKKVDKQLSNLVDLRLNDEISKSDYSKRYQELNNIKQTSECLLSNMRMPAKDINYTLEQVMQSFNKIFDNYSKNNDEAKRELVVQLIDKIVLNEQGYTIYYKFNDFVNKYMCSMPNTERYTSCRKNKFDVFFFRMD